MKNAYNKKVMMNLNCEEALWRLYWLTFYGRIILQIWTHD
jgi:hypothetical protein